VAINYGLLNVPVPGRDMRKSTTGASTRIAVSFHAEFYSSGVPYFIMNEKPTFSGAQSSETMQQVMAQVAEKFPLQSF